MAEPTSPRRKWTAQGASRPSLAPGPRGGATRLSSAQQRLWFLESLDPGRSLYSVFRAYELSGPLRVEALQAAFAEVLRRHEVLRSTFPVVDGQAVQTVGPVPPLPVQVVELGEDAARELAEQEADLPFDLERGPLLRARLVRLGEERHWLLLSLHHIACDARSVELLLGELAAFYAESRLPEPELQYADFASWEARQGDALEALHLPFWRERLSGLTELRLPFDHARPVAQSFRGERRFLPLGVDLGAVGERARELRTTRFTFLLAAFAAFLRRITGQEDMAVGSPFAGRTCPGTEDLVGFFVQTLVLRFDASGDPSFADLVRRVFLSVAEAQAHQDLPFDSLVRALRPERSLSHNPLFQVMFAVQAASANRLDLPGLQVERIPIATRTAKFDLTVEVVEPASLVVEYDSELFDWPTLQRLADAFNRLLAGCLEDPQLPISRLPLLSRTEIHQVLAEWSPPRAAGEEDGAAGLHELFFRQAERTPEAEALIAGNERITYRDLAGRARGLAHRLRELGVGPEGKVGIFAERSAEMIVGLLGTLAAGGAYVPLDPDYPAERIAFILEDAAVPLVLAQSGLIARLPAGNARVVCLEEAIAAAPDPGEAIESALLPGNLAYLIYTSGSTGRPKGVAIAHGSALARMRWARQAFAPEEFAGMLASTSICFDVSVFELFAPLSWGGKLILSRNVLDLPQLPARDEVVSLCTVPSALAELVEMGGLPPRLRTLNLAGEALRGSLVERLWELPGVERVLNLYGPSEDTTYSTLGASMRGEPGEPAIGRPLPGSRAYVLDSRLAVLPRGAVGQLYLAGEGLARGYLGRPDLTAERFLPDPLSPLPGQRLYFSGDLARHRSDGELEFLGRIDHQVKVRGFRIEPGEIEAAISGMEGIREVVVTCEGSSGDVTLAAWFVPDPGCEPSEGTLRAALRERLPEYMVPAQFIRLDALPRTPNGKLDRSALPALSEVSRESAGRPPSTPLEILIADVWSTVLGRSGIGADDDFFDLGGHSLLATRVLSRLREALGVELSVRQVFELRTVAEVASWIERTQQRVHRDLPLVPVPRDRDLPLSFGQERLWFLEQLDPGSAAYNMPTILEIRGPLSPVALAGSLAEITRRHEALRTRFVAGPQGPLQQVAPFTPWAPPCIDLSALPREAARREADRLGRQEATAPFDLARGPLLRATLLRLAAEEHRLLAVFHHIVADGWSLALFFDEMAASPLPELPIQYPDFAVWQRAWLSGAVIEEELAHWRAALDGAPAHLELPTDRPRPAVQTFRGSTWSDRLPGLAAFASQHGVTPFMALLAGLEVLLSRYSGQDDMVVGTTVAGRNRVETEKLIGFFVNTLALRGDLRGDPTVSELLGRVRDAALAAYAHQDLPFERLVAELQPERDLSRTPLFQVLLTLQNAQKAEVRLKGLDVRPLDVETGATKLDLSLSLAEDPEGLAARWTFDSSLYDHATVVRMAGSFAQLLREMVEAPGSHLSGLRMLTAAEREQLAAWNSTAAAIPPDLTLSRLVAAQIDRTPDSVALVFEGETLTYRELGERAGALAERLRRGGVGPEVLVGLLLERSIEMVVGMLGILAAGGAYVPLDPSHPRERLGAMLEDASPKLLVTVDRWRDRIAEKIPVLLLDEMETGPQAALAGEAGPEHLAYVIFTSGSTGRPKGVMNTHRGIVNRLLWAQKTFPHTPGDRVVQKTPATFDVSVPEIFLPLITGARLVLARPDGHRDPAYLAQLISREGITSAHFVPSMLRLFLAEPDLPACLQRVFTSGEALPSDLAELCLARLGAELHNLYGPTEAAVEVTWWECRREAPRSAVPIGYPVENTEIHLLDRDLNQAPPGVPAELYIGGVQVARGYLGRPDLTAERFVPDGVSGRPGDRLYRTGDIAKYQPDGAVEFLGRADHQVKIRGVRIELGEIEAVLRTHPGLADAVVVALPDQRLVAYVVAREPVPAAEMRAWLRNSLPDSMLPAAFVPLAELPLTPSGKVDRRALPEPGLGEREKAGRPLATVTEELLAGIWAEILGQDDLGPEDDFFALGGHSLLATRVAARVREVFHRELPLREIFAAPTLSRLAARIEALGKAPDAAPILSGPEDDLPLSFAQERLWFLEQLRPGTAAYNVPLMLRLLGPLDVERLRQACEEVVRRHAVLRARFETADGEPVQRLTPLEPLPLPVVEGGEALASEEAGRPFDLAQGPLLRLLLLRLGPEHHLLVLNFHHIVADGWSIAVFLREAAALYGGSALPRLPIQYFDFARWQRQRTAELDEQLEFWRQRLAGVPPVLELPFDRPRPSVPTHRGEKVSSALSASVAARLRSLGRERGATLFMTLLASFSALLSRLGSHEELLVGTPFAERSQLATEGLIGLFVNTLALRCDLSGNPGFGTLQERARNVVLEAHARGDLPFERLVQELAPVRETGLPPLVQVLFVLQRSPLEGIALPELEASLVPLPLTSARFDLTLSAMEGGAGLPVVLEYAADLLDAPTAQRWLEHWTVLLEAVSEQPELRLSELPLMSRAQTWQVLAEWNDQASEPLAERCVHELFEQATERWPENVAVEWEGRTLTYAELAARTSRLASRLRRLGVGPDVAVGLCAERSLELVVGMLGILRAGGCYLPLDPQYPSDRLAYMLADSAVRVVVTQQRVRGRLPDAVQFVDLDGEWQETEASGPAAALPGHLVYVIYTSGSTGRPKGTLVAHRGVVNMLRWRQSRYPIGPEDRVLQTDSFSFDASVWQFFWPLSVGARLVLTRPDGNRDSAYLVHLLARRGINVVGLVPSMLQVIVQEPGLEACTALRHVFCGGEALSLDLVEQMCRRLPGLELHNVYGPTEASIDATDATYRGEESDSGGRIAPIGRPLMHQRVYVLDTGGAPAPLGVPGELHIAGVGLARGYRNQPALTAERFVPDGVSGRSGERLYRTGDRVRCLTDGRVEFLGRLDHQVKIRGFRIELSEIEAALAQHPDISASVVVAAGQRLAAYFVAQPQPTAAQVLGFLRTTLPEHMLPAYFIPLPALPLTPNGKIDRQALPAPELDGLAFHAPPRDELERTVAEIWKDVLGIEQIGRDDSFFDLGGHSLRATQVVSRVRRTFDVELPLSVIFESPTLAAFAESLSALRDVGSAPQPPLAAVPRTGEIPLSFAQERLWFLARLEPGSAAYNVPAAMHLAGPLDVGALIAAWSGVAARHEALRTRFAVVAGAPVQRMDDAASVPLPVVDLSALPGSERSHEASRQTAEAMARPFDLAAGPPLRVALLRLGPGEHELVLVLHHLLCDGWSMGILLRELSALYNGAALSALPIQYADYASWQRQWLSGDVLAARLAVWREQLVGTDEVLVLPTDRPRPAVQTDHGSTVSETWPEALKDDVRTLCRREGVTPFMAVLAGFATLLHRYSGQDDFLIGTPVANRTCAEIEGLIGLFANTLVLRARLTGDPDFRTLLARTRETALAAYEHQDVPFERLVEAMRPRRDLSHPPLFQVFYSLQEESAEPSFAGIDIRRQELASGTARFDLTLALGGRGGRFQAACEYNRDLFDEATAERLLEQLRTLLTAAAARPETRLSLLPALTGRERGQLLLEWNETAREYPREACLHELLRQQADRDPARIALEYEDQTLTYAEIHAAADELAAHLSALGAGPESRVAVCLERSPGMVIALLAVLKAGAAYLPLDPAHPRERLATILTDSRPTVVLVDSEQERALAGLVGPEILLVDPQRLNADAPRLTPRPATSDNLAYVIFTSGSTGRPKGVQITHRSLVNYLVDLEQLLGIGAGDSILAVTTISFDIAGFEIWMPLLTGGRIVLAGRNAAQDSSSLAQLLARSGATILQATPATWRLLIAAGWEGGPHLRAALCGGEALPAALADTLQARAPGAELWNLYGPTETTIFSAVRRVPPGEAPVRVGQPVANTRLYVLDRSLEAVPIGVPGELWIAGDGLARGYFGRPDLTAERFRPDPFAGPAEAGTRLYSTGDLVRYRPDSTIEFLGRLDHQLKVRGFRIEPGEIEAVLRRHPSVREAVVVPRGEDLERRLVAFVIPAGNAEIEPAALRAFAQGALPEYMVPALFVPLTALPLTPNGKVDQRALPSLQELRQEAPDRDLPALNRLEASLAALWRELLAREDIGRDDSFFDLGGHSLLLVRFQERLEQTLGRSVPILDLFRFPTIAALAEHLSERKRDAPAQVRPDRVRRDEAIAVVGMAGRFPGATDVEAFWNNLRNGVESISWFTREEMLASGVDPDLLDDPGYVPAKGVLDGADLFAASFFGYSPREAEMMDPQHRVFLECAWECLENAGHDPGRHPGRIGVFAGAAMNTYLLSMLLAHRALVLSAGGYPIAIGNDKDHLTTRVSYRLNLRGPSVLVQSACSTSLVAVHLACRSLLDGDCDMALAGGVAVSVPLQGGHLYREGGILSPDGRCRTFDVSARGIVGGNGAGLVALRRLEDALADGDCIRAVIKGSAINNDGHLKAGYTAPSTEGQVDVIRQALARAGVGPDAISYIEAHGTGTALGDPIEVAALHQVFGPAVGHRAFCALGSVKTNIGHLDTAAGVAGLIKTILALEHRELPPSLHFERPNPELGLAESPLFVNARRTDWSSNGEPRRAGVSSFGIGGTNAHVVVEEAPAPPPSLPAALPWQLLPISAQSAPALAAVASRLAAHLRAHPELELAQVAYTLQAGRAELKHRGFVVCTDTAGAAKALTAISPADLGTASGPEPPVAFLLPGQGSQYLDMGRELYGLEPRFQAEVDRCAEELAPRLGRDLRAAMFPSNGISREAAEHALEQTELTQPALFTIEYALARLWMSWGIRPQAMLGHSLGELVAATLAGVWSLEDALVLVAERGRLMQRTAPGVMLAVELSEEELMPLLEDGLSLAAVNAPRSSVVSGPALKVMSFEERLQDLKADYRRLRVSHAFHSALVNPAQEVFETVVRRIALQPPRIPFLSNVTGTWITPEQATDPAYWARQIRATVRFSPAVAELLSEPGRVLLEVGPGQALSSLARRQAAAEAAKIIPSLPRSRKDRSSDLESLLTAAGRLWLAGARPDWEALHADRRPRRVPLPTYPFERQRFWLGEGLAETRPELPGEVEAVSDFISPADEVEAAIAGIWQELLGLRTVGSNDDFFALGGDSLLATRVIARVQEKLGVQIPLSSALEQTTVSALAAVCRQARQQSPQAKEISRLLSDVAGLSTDELERMLAGSEPGSTSSGDLK